MSIAKWTAAAFGAATIAAPAASAGLPPSSGSYIGHPGGPGGVGLVSVLPSFGSYIGHPGGPGGVDQVVLTPTTVTQPPGGFAWGDAGVGAGFMTGIGLLAAAGGLMLRRRRVLAPLPSK